ncbi:hypothetical protein B0A58_08680 [Flavobacterium branchiophilum NBRC 15030 = ATCC 35035]|uniref:Uncharacterized protein n=1 Tax=Flavobacterium branchiophilum TaxID=55197 RepID=A0A543G269_9FLAO|nr:hypothetical protein [Flavobacterium branchiophilum]OXA75485.1 hypothetical protein B0A58_08680 [Flavobacterium branchiophilum NBRC 15030 = ATCC 35035]TQM40196.1 hypothetical protein BC670_1069 [Flavobacterium branchiophilum]GEM56475.1 hypothetical protein FB1_26960 [Flavobacterium branchiophilum NBRC 15030 = ATCC 35035]
MTPLNQPQIKETKRSYYIMFSITFLFIFSCLVITLVTANKGVAELEQKHKYYNDIVVKQGEMNLILDEILVQLNDLRFKDRTLNERKNLQSLINEKRFIINAEIQKSKKDLNNPFTLYEEFLLEIQQIQTKIDVLKETEGLFAINKKQLEKCIEKQQEEINKLNKK